MRVSWNWLGEFVELADTPERVAERLTMAGLEVESIDRLGTGLEHVVVAEIVSVASLPSDPQLKVCEVNTGASAGTVSVTGLGVAAGQRVALALLGARLPGGTEVRLEEVGGVRSEARICSEADLRLGSNERAPLVLPAAAALGTPVAEVLGLDDVVLDISVTPNRGDCLSVLGIAREIAALTGRRLRRPRIRVVEHLGQSADFVRVSIASEAACHRYVARVFPEVRIEPSPLWMQCRLRAVGLRPVNNVVDVTNYVLWERGQPLHAFDFDRLPAPEITVRHATDAEEFVSLDGVVRRIEPGDLLITSGGQTVALAGIIGGANSEVSENTRRVLLESAWFSPSTIRRTAKRLGLKTEASYRFERGVDIEGVALAADRAASLFVDLCGAKAAVGQVDVYPRPYLPAPIAVRVGRAEELLGFSLARQELVTALRGLGFEVSAATRGTVSVTPPSYRSDVEREVDVVEEVARVLGYERIPSVLPRTSLGGRGLGEFERLQREVRRLMAGLGFHEAIPLAFVSQQENVDFPGVVAGRQPVALQNPLSREDAEMRLSLLSSLVRSARTNLAQGAEAVPLFLLGKVFWREGDRQFCECTHVGAIVCPRFWEHGIGWRKKATEFEDIKGVVETLLESLRVGEADFQLLVSPGPFHPGRVAVVQVSGEPLGVVGALHPRLERAYELASPCWAFELDLEKSLQYRRRRFSARSLPRFPAVKRDLAIVVDEGFAAGKVIQFVRQWGAGECSIETVELVDQYSGAPIPAGRKSLTYSIWYRSADRTLTDAEVNEAHLRLGQALVEQFGVQLR